MQHKKSILTAVILSGSIGLGVSSISAQTAPGGKQSEQPIPERVQPPAGEGRQQGTGAESRQQGTASMSSDDIKKAKEALKARGHDPGSIDGNMDSKTQQALRDFQKANNLPVTGVLDQQTAAKLGIASSSQPGSRQQGQEGSGQQRQQGSTPQRGGQDYGDPGAKEAK
ncbi:MAG TPA: peptidoglycan-binding domain-containing protein [Candidatus Binatia bacterium]|jgi:peptidoglycan hydrolase-like protein with peptidoglycan-binding domain|nr:peptidoglycan-binding domain-containing protein [Candidatus Binatia bacterium]